MKFDAYGSEYRKFDVAPDAARKLTIEYAHLSLGLPEGAWIDTAGFLCITHDRPPRDEKEVIRLATAEDIEALNVIRRIGRFTITNKMLEQVRELDAELTALKKSHRDATVKIAEQQILIDSLNATVDRIE